MKKLITITLSIAFALCAFAKTQTELIAEFKALSTNKAKAMYVMENKADVLKVWNTNKGSDLTKTDRLAYKYNSDEYILKLIFAKLYDHSHTEMNASDLEVIYIESGVISKTKDLDWYESIKANGFVCEGKAISERAKAHLVCRFNDVNEVLKLNMKTYMYSAHYVKALQFALLNIEPVKAKAICSEFEKLFILNNQSVPTQIKAVSKYLTQKILDAKIIK